MTHDEHAGQAAVRQPARVLHVLQVQTPGEWGVAELAGAQRNVAHVDQLAACGLGRGAVEYRRKVGRFHLLLPRVVAIGSPVLPPLGRETAALLYAGDNAFLGNRTVGALWGIVPASPGLRWR